MILLFRETLFLMILLIFSVTSFSIYFFRQKDAKMDPKNDQNGTTNHQKTRFLIFFGVLEKKNQGFWKQKNQSKIWKNPEKVSEGALGPLK